MGEECEATGFVDIETNAYFENFLVPFFMCNAIIR